MSNLAQKDRLRGLSHVSILALSCLFLCLTRIFAQVSRQESGQDLMRSSGGGRRKAHVTETSG